MKSPRSSYVLGLLRDFFLQGFKMHKEERKIQSIRDYIGFWIELSA